MNIEVKDISMILVENLLKKKPELQDKFKAALGENWKKEVHEEKLVFAELGQAKKIKKKNIGAQHHIQNEAENYSPTRFEETKQFDTKNAYEFPDLDKTAGTQTSETGAQEKIGNTGYAIKKTGPKKKAAVDMSGWANKNPFLNSDYKKDGATKLEEDFPTLGGPSQPDKKAAGGEAEFWKKAESKTQPSKKQAEQYDDYYDDDYYEGEEQTSKGGTVDGMKIAGVQKSKKGKQKIFLAGAFK
eukprot:CAMPEP_0176415678 /NCGR_PEP_ID=MMETSP0127-20121128/5936_1 /TAXON_ID=938130 /ORGANISM="Platyophrya macrostoma, Strain WH" /LENGTH=242 /DNA_ID=CAMNT_0017795693 /DNA_START=311 /DNA_END=1039 /DNA_ORIENTATION=+